ncbi:hypothetical protein HK100_009141 [Physocladia obscura]|uniref:Uncharacterized protein n=1 Tax=Physocladia obscura TaxID=109957 RepID=A0AAD5SPT8_9FUNG|nr:hypothetical protein HK100_009141 [Physocladia obscura]
MQANANRGSYTGPGGVNLTGSGLINGGSASFHHFGVSFCHSGANLLIGGVGFPNRSSSQSIQNNSTGFNQGSTGFENSVVQNNSAGFYPGGSPGLQNVASTLLEDVGLQNSSTSAGNNVAGGGQGEHINCNDLKR